MFLHFECTYISVRLPLCVSVQPHAHCGRICLQSSFIPDYPHTPPPPPVWSFSVSFSPSLSLSLALFLSLCVCVCLFVCLCVWAQCQSNTGAFHAGRLAQVRRIPKTPYMLLPSPNTSRRQTAPDTHTRTDTHTDTQIQSHGLTYTQTLCIITSKSQHRVKTCKRKRKKEWIPPPLPQVIFVNRA